MAKETPIQTHTTALLAADAIKWLLGILWVAIASCFSLGSLRDHFWIGLTESGWSGWFILIIVVALSFMPACWLARRLVRSKVRDPAPSKLDQSPFAPPKTFAATISSPTNRAMISPKWVEIKGMYTGDKEHYWLLNNLGDQFWPHTSIQLLADGNWVQKIYIDPQPTARDEHVILAWVSPSMHAILESWRAKSARYQKYDGIRMTPPTGHFEVIEVRTLQVHPVPEEMSLTLVTSHVELVLVRGNTYEIEYEIEAYGPLATDCWLGSSIKDSSGRYFNNRNEDQPITLIKGKQVYRRRLTVPKDTTPGNQTMSTNVWRGVVGDVSKSKFIVDLPPKRVSIVE